MKPKRKPLIAVVDLFLILFIVILLIQSACNLFFPKTLTPDMNAIDVVIRTSAATIFGYFLSGQDKVPPASSESKSLPPPIQISSSQAAENTPSSQIGFSSDSTSSGSAETLSPPVLSSEPIVKSSSINLSVVVVAVVGLSSLILLLIVRNFVAITPSMIATLSQLRDFVCGCIGFLVRQSPWNPSDPRSFS